MKMGSGERVLVGEMNAGAKRPKMRRRRSRDILT